MPPQYRTKPQMNKILMGAAMGALVLASAGSALASGTDYTFTATPGNIAEGFYGVETTPITQRPDNAWGDYSAPVGAPATFEVINAATNSGERFWYDFYNLTAGTTYDVTAVLANNYPVSAPTIELTAGGSPVGAVQTLAFTGNVTGGATGPWQTLTFAYTPTTSGSVTLGLVDTNLDAQGNDFSLSSAKVSTDGVVISAAPEPAAWALLMLAVGMIGTSLRLRRRRSAVAAA